jgi:hypothetical protein
MRLNCFTEILLVIQIEVFVFFLGASRKIACWNNAVSFPFLLCSFLWVFPFQSILFCCSQNKLGLLLSIFILVHYTSSLRVMK